MQEKEYTVFLWHLSASGLLVFLLLESKGYIWLLLSFFFVKVAALSKRLLNGETFRADFLVRPWRHVRKYEGKKIKISAVLKHLGELLLVKPLLGFHFCFQHLNLYAIIRPNTMFSAFISCFSNKGKIVAFLSALISRFSVLSDICLVGFVSLFLKR